jgi:hypothetical protein
MNKVIYTLACARAGEKEIYEKYERLISFFPNFIRRAYTGVQQYFE